MWIVDIILSIVAIYLIVVYGLKLLHFILDKLLARKNKKKFFGIKHDLSEYTSGQLETTAVRGAILQDIQNQLNKCRTAKMAEELRTKK